MLLLSKAPLPSARLGSHTFPPDAGSGRLTSAAAATADTTRILPATGSRGGASQPEQEAKALTAEEDGDEDTAVHGKHLSFSFLV